MCDKQGAHFVNVVIDIVNFNNKLADALPIVIGDAAQHLVFAAFHIDFEQVNRFDLVLLDDL